MSGVWPTRTLLAVCLLAVLALPVRAQDQWVSIGPHWPDPVNTIAPSPGWPGDGTMLVLFAQDSFGRSLVRTRDGGESWQPVELPGESAEGKELWFEQGPGGRIALFRSIVPNRGSTPTTITLYRSADDGDTWAQVWTDNVIGSEVYFSPNFASDGVVYHKVGDQLLKSTDTGLTWAPFSLAENRDVLLLASAPANGPDHTMVAALSVANPNREARRRDTGVTPETDSKLMLSKDSGATWSDIANPPTTGKRTPE